MHKTSLPDLFFYLQEDYNSFLYGNRTSLAVALIKYADYKQRGGKRIHEGLEEILKELNK
jgi:hypothetical protein